MMTAFPNPHGGAMQHPGMPHGQPMGPGQVHHPGQPMGQPIMHPGVSAPGGPMVTQGGPMMAGMQPGMSGPGGPNAHAMSHLNPQMMQQQNMQMNPMLQQQLRNNMLRQQQQAQYQQQQQHLHAQQQQQHHQQHHGAMPMGFQGTPGMTPQQLHQMQAASQHMGGVPQQMGQMHPQQMALLQQQQRQMIQQAQQQQQQQNLAAQQAHQQAQQAAQLAQAQAHAMQHANSQSSNHPTPQPMQGQSGPPTSGPMRPPTAMSVHEAQSSPAPVGKQQQAPPPQPVSTGPQGPSVTASQMNQPRPNAPTAGPTAPQQQKQGPGAPQPQPGQGGPGAQSAAQPQVQAQQGQQLQQRTPQQVQAQNSMAQAMLARAQMPNRATLRLFKFCDAVASIAATPSMTTSGLEPNDIQRWSNLIHNFFTDTGSYSLILHEQSAQNQNEIQPMKPKQFQVIRSLLPRFFYDQLAQTIYQIQIIIEGVLETPRTPENNILVTADRAKIIYALKDGTQIIAKGNLQAFFNNEHIESLVFESEESEHFIPRRKLEELCALASPPQTKSPKLTKNAGPKKNAKAQAPQQPAFDMRHLPVNPLESGGINLGVEGRTQLWLECCESFGLMQDIMVFSRENPNLTPTEALKEYIPMNQKQLNQIQHNLLTQGALAQGGQRMLNGTVMGQPGAEGFVAMSPAMQASMMPNTNGSPHLPPGLNSAGFVGPNHGHSPALSHMAPPMAAQLSQQGTASGASAGTSPNLSVKRRRSTHANVKGEDSEVNGAVNKKVKPSPQMAKGTRK